MGLAPPRSVPAAQELTIIHHHRSLDFPETRPPLPQGALFHAHAVLPSRAHRDPGSWPPTPPPRGDPSGSGCCGPFKSRSPRPSPSTRRRSRIQPGRGSCRLAQSCPAPAQPPTEAASAARRGGAARPAPARPYSRPDRSRLSRARSSPALRGRGPRRLPAPAPRPRSPGPCGLGPAGARRAPGEMRLRNGTFLTLLLFCLCAFLSLSWYAALSGQKGEPPPRRRPRRPAPGAPEPLPSSPHLFAAGVTKFPGSARPRRAGER